MFQDRYRGGAARLAACGATLCLLVGAAVALAAAAAPPPIAARAAFDLLKQLQGVWQGTAGDMPDQRVQYRVASGGSVVMETLFAGTPHEMISMYHLDGEDLVMTHYCSMGNQPRMRLDPGQSSPKHLSFVFTGGSNLKSDKDAHIHSGTIDLLDADHIDAAWTVYEGGRQKDVKAFKLARMKD